MTVLRLFNSATRTVEPFTPLKQGEVGIYNCGPTVYDYQHIGNLYGYIAADVVRRTFEYLGYTVKQVMNITDVGHLVGDADTAAVDKMAIGARREGIDPLVMAEKYTEQFMIDRRKLNIGDPRIIAKATEHITEMIALIERLITKGHAYAASDGVYFDTTTFPGYGTRLNPEPPDSREAGARVEVNPNKRNPFDFALWRAAKAGDLQQWESPWGRGNPGWHIECSAMSMKYLGESFDLHSGGEDHLFPHHECEIAQSEAATGKRFVNYWLHHHFLKLDSAKMAKSAGVFFRLDELLSRGHDPLAFRMLALGVSYRKGLDFTWDALAESERRLNGWRSQIRDAAQRTTAEVPAQEDPIRSAFAEAIGDDFNTPRALAQAEAALKLVNSTDEPSRRRGLGLLFDMDRVLGLGLEASATTTDDLDPEDRRLFEERVAARASGDFKRSDELRLALEIRGIKVKDTKDGTRWERIAKGSAS